jgi:hypothetical protein
LYNNLMRFIGIVAFSQRAPFTKCIHSLHECQLEISSIILTCK